MTQANPPPLSGFDKHFPPIALELGRLIFAWNELHEELGHIYEAVLKPRNSGAALASWRAIESDRIQRTMLKYAVEAVKWPKTDKRPSTPEDILWLLEKTNRLAEHRNNAIHSPFAVLTTDGETGIVPLDFFGNPRAMKLAAKDADLASEVNFYFRRARALSHFAIPLSSALREPLIAWPDRPSLPER